MEQPEFISLITLIQSPDKFEGKAIRVVGLCTLGFEGKAIWASGEALDKAITKDAIWLEVPLTDKLRTEHQKVMIVEGVFTAQRKGHLGLYSGTIEQISRIDRWEE